MSSSNSPPLPRDIDEGYQQFELNKWLDSMVSSTTIPDKVGAIIFPHAELASMLTPYIDDEIEVISESSSECLLRHGSDGDVESTLPNINFAKRNIIDEDTILDLRLGSPK